MRAPYQARSATNGEAIAPSGSQATSDPQRCPLCRSIIGEVAPQRRRSQALQWYKSGVSAGEIARRLGVSHMAVYYWIRLYAPDGLLLKRRRRGRQPAIGPTELKRLRALTQLSPQVYGIDKDAWSSGALAELIVKIFNLRLSRASAVRLKKHLSDGGR